MKNLENANRKFSNKAKQQILGLYWMEQQKHQIQTQWHRENVHVRRFQQVQDTHCTVILGSLLPLDQRRSMFLNIAKSNQG